MRRIPVFGAMRSAGIAGVAALAAGLAGGPAAAPALAAEPAWNVTLLGHYPGTFDDVWGYSDANGEYALVATGDSLLVIDVTNPAAPVKLSGIQRSGNSLQDVDVRGHYAYGVQQDGALRIVDLTNPAAVTVAGNFSNANITGGHTIYIDGDRAYLCMAGDGFADLRILSLANPVAPVELGSWRHARHGYPAITEAHEAYARGDTLYLSYLSGGLVVLDVSNPASPVPLGFREYPGEFTHSAWTTEDGRYILTADETVNGHLRVWDGQDLANILPVAEYRSSGERTIHQVNVKGDFAYVSYYSDGLRVVDVSDPTGPVETGFYDTYPGDGPGFKGGYGVYPYAPSGNLYVSDLSTGLWILSFNGAHAGRVAGTVRGPDGEEIEGATVTALGPGKSTATSAAGTYALDFGAGTTGVAASRYGYLPDTLAVAVAEGATTVADFTLARLPSGSLGGTVRNPGGIPLPGILVALEGVAVPPETTDALGAYDFGPLPSGVPFTLSAARFGHASATRPVTLATGVPAVEDFSLGRLLQDDFELHQGWTVGDPSDGADQGLWGRVVPNGTLVFGQPAQPYTDHTADPAAKAFVTGPSPPGASASAFDLDLGKTTLYSPVFDVTFLGAPVLHYWRWLSNTAPGNPGTGVFEAAVSNDGGATWAILERTNAHANTWTERTFALADHVTPTGTMRFRFVAMDSVGTIYEAALDDVSVTGTVLDAGDGAEALRARILAAGPSPFAREMAVSFQLARTERVAIRLYDVGGRAVATLLDAPRDAGRHRVEWDGASDGGRPVASGVYFLVFETPSVRETRKIVRSR